MDVDDVSYLGGLSEILSKFRKSGQFCDTVIATRDRELQAHSILLAAASPVFQSIFKVAVADELGNYYLEMPMLDGATAECVLEIIYTGSPRLWDEIPVDQGLLLDTCQQLGVNYTQNELAVSSHTDCASNSPDETKLCDQSAVESSGVKSFTSKSFVLAERNETTSMIITIPERHFGNSETSIIPADMCKESKQIPGIDGATAVEDSSDDDACGFIFVCDICSKTFRNGNDLKRHRRCHEGCAQCAECGLLFRSIKELHQHLCSDCKAFFVQCHLCSRPFPDRSDLPGHASSSHGDCRDVCQVCFQPCSTSLTLRLHQSLHNAGDELCVYSCSECRQQFAGSALVEQHINDEHLSSGLVLFVCLACSFAFQEYSELLNHVEAHGSFSDTRPITSQDDSTSAVDHDSTNKCDICGKTLNPSRRTVRRPGLPLVCDACEIHVEYNIVDSSRMKPLSSSSSANGNQQRQQYTCDSCQKSFGRVSDLRVHVRCHTAAGVGDFEFECFFCARRFRKKNTLERHLRVHTGERPYVCETCGKSFKIAFHLHQHHATHADERAFECETCGKAFHNAVRLRKHVVIHNGLKPFACSICQRSFNRKSNMLAHMRVHNPRRGESFLTLVTVNDGGQSVNGQSSPFQCSQCGGFYSKLAELDEHRSRSRCSGAETIVTINQPSDKSEFEDSYSVSSCGTMPSTMQYIDMDDLC